MWPRVFRPASQSRDEPLVRHDDTQVPALGERATEFVRMPPGAGGQNRYVHDPSKSDALRTSTFTRPAWNVRPLVALVSQTSPGLKSSGSIL